MNANERREQIIDILNDSKEAISGSRLSKILSVSRQVIVTDVAILRAKGIDIVSTPAGYVLSADESCERIFKVHHTEKDTQEELNLFVDCGGIVKDIFVSHRAYGIIKAKLDLHSRMDVEEFMESIKSGKSSSLSKITDGYHYHTVEARSEEVLDKIEDKLWEKGFLAKPLDYEPEEFVKNLSKRKK